jgi:5'-deoxynucleotidase YfbR-like HD superfamily hydrolase
MMTEQDELVSCLTGVARLALVFGRIERTTAYPDGTRESDADHTVMLTWLAPALARHFYPGRLDPGLVALRAGLHDAVEVFAGDTCTLRISVQEMAAKRDREKAALQRWRDLLTGTPLCFIAEEIAAYEEQRDAEARFVRAVDKLCPALAHLLNQGALLFGTYRFTAAELEESLPRRLAEMKEYASDFPEVIALREHLSLHLIAMLREREEKKE